MSDNGGNSEPCDHSKPGPIAQRNELLIKYARLHVHMFTLATRRTLP